MTVTFFLAVVCLCAAIYFWLKCSRLEHDRNSALQAAGACEADLRRELGAAQAEFEALFANCGAAILLVDSAGVVSRANPLATQLLGAGQELTQKSLVQATLSTDMPVLVKAARESTLPVEREVRMPGPAGRVLRVVAVPLSGGTGGALLVAHDVTSLLHLSTMRRDFVANVSHELRTPLASIRAMAETLQNGALEDPEVAPRFLATIVVEADRLTRIAADLLVLSDAESRSPEKSSFSLTQLIEQIANRVQSQTAQAGIDLEAMMPPEPIRVCASRDQIEQVLVNLVDNAIKYTGRGGSVRVTARQVGLGAEVTVCDTGIGIMQQDLPRIFERFYRVDKARSRQSGGTGLGLAIVKHIVEAHGGQVTVQSDYNHGSQFQFTLP